MESNTLKKNGYEVSIICPKGKGFESDHECINGINIYRHYLPSEISSTAGYIREYLFALYHEFRLALKIKKKHGFDIIQICNPPDILFLVTIWFKWLYRCKVIFDHHDLNPELFESKFNKRGFFYHMLKIAEKLTFKTADMVISTNESYKEIAIKRGNKDENKVHVVRSGPDLSFFKLQPKDINIKNGRKYLVGYLGVMGEFDGVDTLIKSASIIVNDNKRTDIQFCLVGSGPCFDDLIALTKELGLDDFIEFTGRVSDQDLLRYLSTCDICVNPDPVNSLNDKSTMNKILEYMALAKPIVQFDVLEGRRSALEASWYAEPNDLNDFAEKIIKLCDSDDSVKKTMGDFGLQRMTKELEWKYQSKKLIEAYSSI
ncbi:glycosyltransferase family 4 protein [Ekhidna sp.]|uniref:glycosyltransferase family 4 protein n=2 Tax=Ekhidna sp. TaxID=2608089 RepID=UPI003299EE68